MASKRDTKSLDLFTKTASAMPDAYYSGDKPNPNLRAFVEQHYKRRELDQTTDSYDKPPFNTPLQTTKVDPIYNLHPYDSKKSHLAIRRYINHYCKPGDLVLDPFCGSGSTLVAASAEGCPSIGVDFSPLALLISREAVSACSSTALDEAFARVTRLVEGPIGDLYATRCHRCGGPATITGTVLSEQFQCLRCLTTQPFSQCTETENDRTRLCRQCAARGIESKITTSFERKGVAIVEVAYRCHGACKPKRDRRSLEDVDPKACRALKEDIEHFQSIEVTMPIPDGVRRRMLDAPEAMERWGLLWRPYLRGFNTVADFFTPRNLQACLLLLEAIRNTRNEALLVALSSVLAKSSHLMAQNSDGIGRVMKGTYYVGAIRREVNVWQFFCEAVQALKDTKEDIASTVGGPVILSCQDSCDLGAIRDNSVDYIFTDPPYSGKVQFGELNFLREAFLELGVCDLSKEIIVNEERGLSEGDWSSRMLSVAREMFRVLKPGRWMTLCYHDTSEGTWAELQDIVAEAGFLADTNTESLFIETSQKSIKQITAHKITKRDLVINFRKPRPGEASWGVSFTGTEDHSTFREKVEAIICTYLSTHQGSSIDRIYDEVVSRMVRAGQMEAHNFDEILRSVAEEVKTPIKKDLFRNEDPNLFGTHEVSRWYLKETELDVGDAAESAKEDKAAEKLESFMKAHLKKHPEDEGVHYSDLFEQYVYGVKEKPRRQLADFLPDYFFKTEAGTWRPPTSAEEAKAKAEGRAKGTGRRVKRYIALLEQGVAIPDRARPNDASLAEWIRHCKRAGLYDQGKLLYEKGGLNLDKLPEDIMVGVEEDYQVCVRMLARDEGAKPARKRTGAKE